MQAGFYVSILIDPTDGYTSQKLTYLELTPIEPGSHLRAGAASSCG